MKKIVLISGIPSVGKSNLLEGAVTYEATAINLEAPAQGLFSLERAGLGEAWKRFIQSEPSAFLKGLNQIENDLVLIEWGFPPNCLHLVQLLHEHGVRTWWLDGDRSMARIQHAAAGKDLPAFDSQMRKIEADWHKLSAFYGERLILRLSGSGAFISEKAMYERLFGKRMYHGSTDKLEVVSKGSCVSGGKDMAFQYAMGKVPSSAGYRRDPGWIYELLVESGQVHQDGIDQKLTTDLQPERVIPAAEHRPKTAAELLGM